MRKDFHYFEHSGDAASAGLGSHTMVIADHNGSFRPNAQAEIAFAEPGATMRQDSLDRWRSEVRLQTNAIELGSWDYRSLGMRPVQAASALPQADDHILALAKIVEHKLISNPAGAQKFAPEHSKHDVQKEFGEQALIDAEKYYSEFGKPKKVKKRKSNLWKTRNSSNGGARSISMKTVDRKSVV